MSKWCSCGKHPVTEKRGLAVCLRPRINALHSKAYCVAVEHGRQGARFTPVRFTRLEA